MPETTTSGGIGEKLFIGILLIVIFVGAGVIIWAVAQYLAKPDSDSMEAIMPNTMLAIEATRAASDPELIRRYEDEALRYGLGSQYSSIEEQVQAKLVGYAESVTLGRIIQLIMPPDLSSQYRGFAAALGNRRRIEFHYDYLLTNQLSQIDIRFAIGRTVCTLRREGFPQAEIEAVIDYVYEGSGQTTRDRLCIPASYALSCPSPTRSEVSNFAVC